MLIIRGTQDIYMSRGDDKRIAVNLTERSAEGATDYGLEESEYIIFKLWDDRLKTVLKTMTSDRGTSVLHFPAEFTEGLSGRYSYSVDLVFMDGTKETIIGQSPSAIPKFVVLEA